MWSPDSKRNVFNVLLLPASFLLASFSETKKDFEFPYDSDTNMRQAKASVAIVWAGRNKNPDCPGDQMSCALFGDQMSCAFLQVL